MITELRGLETGDALIRETARAIVAAVEDDGLVKYGGVVFGVLLIGIDDDVLTNLFQVFIRTLEDLNLSRVLTGSDFSMVP